MKFMEKVYNKMLYNKISLVTYIRLGGKVSLLDPYLISTNYNDSNRDTEIIKIEEEGKNKSDEPLYLITFKSGNKIYYAGIFIDVRVEMKLKEIYYE